MTYEYTELDPKVEYVKIHGLQRSGTNYLAFLVDENFENAKALVNLGGWKHGPYQAPWAIGKEVHVLTIAKNPYAWLVSVYRYWGLERTKNIGPDLTGVTFDHFVRNRLILERQNDVPMLFRASNPVQHWNNMNFHWSSIHLNEKKMRFVTYEMLLNRTDLVLQKVAKDLGLATKEGRKHSETTFIHMSEKSMEGKDKFNEDYYKQHQYLRYYTSELIDFVNHEVDLNVIAMLGYSLIAPDRLVS